MSGPTLTLSIEARDAEIGARRMDQALRLVRTGAKATEDVVDKMADKLSRVGGSSNLATAIGRGVETSVQRARTALIDLERTADRTVSGIGRSISAGHQAIDDLSRRFPGAGTAIPAVIRPPAGDLMLSGQHIVQVSNQNNPPRGFSPIRDILDAPPYTFFLLQLRQQRALIGERTYLQDEDFSGPYTEIVDLMNNSLDRYLIDQGNLSNLIGYDEADRMRHVSAIINNIMATDNMRAADVEEAMQELEQEMVEWRQLWDGSGGNSVGSSQGLGGSISSAGVSVRFLYSDLSSGLEHLLDFQQRSIEDPNATEYERELISSLISEIGEGERIVGGWLDQLDSYSGELFGARIAAVGVPRRPPPRSTREAFRSFGAFSRDLLAFDEVRLADGVSIADIHENFPALEPVRVPLELDIAGLEPLTERQISDLWSRADRAMADLQQDYDEALPELAGSIVNRDGGRADRLATGLSQMTGISTRALGDRIAPILGDEADAFARNLVEAWRRAYFEALVDTIGGSERQGATVDGTDLGFRDVGQSILDGQLASSVVTADMLPVGGLEAVVPTAEEIELLMARSEALRAQSGVLDAGFTPATKGAAEATMELADAAVGLDAALKAPDPAAMAEDMEELSALGQQVGNSFASAFERAIFSGEELSDVLSALALDLAQLVLRESVLGPLAIGIGRIVGSIFHEGGLVGQGGVSRPVSPLIFAGASRYHFGGLAGDEVPAILRRGEEVLTRDDPRHRANGGLGGGRAGGGVAIHQTISIDAKAVNENGVDGAAADTVGRQMRAAVRSAVQAEIAQQSRVGGMLNRV